MFNSKSLPLTCVLILARLSSFDEVVMISSMSSIDETAPSLLPGIFFTVHGKFSRNLQGR